MANERDTHFQNAAKLLVEKTMATKAMDTVDATRFLNDDDLAELRTLFAHFLFDFFVHTLAEFNGVSHEWVLSFLSSIPDMTEWPDTAPLTLGEVQEALKSIPGVTEWLNTSPEAP